MSVFKSLTTNSAIPDLIEGDELAAFVVIGTVLIGNQN